LDINLFLWDIKTATVAHGIGREHRMSGRSQDIADTLTLAIVDRRLAPGRKLGERELAEIFGVSRIVVRQALIRLAEDDLVVIERNRGAFVARPGLQEALDIYGALTAIERGVAAQLTDRLGPSGWAELRKHIERQRAAVAAGNKRLADDLGQEFHLLLVRLGRNRVMQEIHDRLLRRTTLLRSLITADFDYCSLQDEHSRIVDLLEKGRVKQALDLIDSHYRAVVRSYNMDAAAAGGLSLPEALAPYRKAAPRPAGRRKVRASAAPAPRGRNARAPVSRPASS
jgi:DNA-binding GntR family transcriptional regulator